MQFLLGRPVALVGGHGGWSGCCHGAVVRWAATQAASTLHPACQDPRSFAPNRPGASSGRLGVKQPERCNDTL